jgi:hypothetical protein
MNTGIEIKPIDWNKEKGELIKRYTVIQGKKTNIFTEKYKELDKKLSLP